MCYKELRGIPCRSCQVRLKKAFLSQEFKLHLSSGTTPRPVGNDQQLLAMNSGPESCARARRVPASYMTPSVNHYRWLLMPNGAPLQKTKQSGKSISTVPWPHCPTVGFFLGGGGRLFVCLGLFLVLVFFYAEMSPHQTLWHSVTVVMTSQSPALEHKVGLIQTTSLINEVL